MVKLLLDGPRMYQVDGPTLEIMVTIIAKDFAQGESNQVVLTTHPSGENEVSPLRSPSTFMTFYFKEKVDWRELVRWIQQSSLRRNPASPSEKTTSTNLSFDMESHVTICLLLVNYLSCFYPECRIYDFLVCQPPNFVVLLVLHRLTVEALFAFRVIHCGLIEIYFPKV
ncbi:unnamed protein product [Protopolystoma xenopodis]|uniref:Uncharacterized protein n=1 Tax=Protopolystoma xenopodis TaxID=117903 RepID=A0A3S5AMA9_9PLAT|nr:unnamed protein product [Protopolystoma xenopodis]